MIVGVLNVIYGIGAISNSNFFVHHANYMFGNLKTWGWVSLVLGILELLASVSLFRRNDFGRYFAILVGVLAAIDALLDIPAYPLWSLAVFAVTVWIIYGLTVGSGPSESEYVPMPSESARMTVGPRPPA
jgi:hypothetical protein